MSCKLICCAGRAIHGLGKGNIGVLFCQGIPSSGQYSHQDLVLVIIPAVSLRSLYQVFISRRLYLHCEVGDRFFASLSALALDRHYLYPLSF